MEKTVFSYTLSSSISLENVIDNEYCSIGQLAYVGTAPDGIISGFTNCNSSYEDRYFYFLDFSCGSRITMDNNIFTYCFCFNPKNFGGGAVLVNYPCTVIIQTTLFDHCYTNSIWGGAILISGGISTSYNIDLNDTFTDYVQVQYCCFQHCHGNSNYENYGVYGTAAYLAGYEARI